MALQKVRSTALRRCRDGRAYTPPLSRYHRALYIGLLRLAIRIALSRAGGKKGGMAWIGGERLQFSLYCEEMGIVKKQPGWGACRKKKKWGRKGWARPLRPRSEPGGGSLGRRRVRCFLSHLIIETPVRGKGSTKKGKRPQGTPSPLSSACSRSTSPARRPLSRAASCIRPSKPFGQEGLNLGTLRPLTKPGTNRSPGAFTL